MQEEGNRDDAVNGHGRKVKRKTVPWRKRGPIRRSIQGNWTPEEDAILIKSVRENGAKNWKLIAAPLNSRTDIQCLHRWQKVLNPELIKGEWKKEEDDLITALVKEHGCHNWSVIAKYVPGRIGKQCRERWLNHLDPVIKTDPWTNEEVMALVSAHKTYGNGWAEIAKVLPGRSANSIKNHWNCSLKKRHVPGAPDLALGITSLDLDNTESETKHRETEPGKQSYSSMTGANSVEQNSSIERQVFSSDGSVDKWLFSESWMLHKPIERSTAEVNNHEADAEDVCKSQNGKSAISIPVTVRILEVGETSGSTSSENLCRSEDYYPQGHNPINSVLIDASPNLNSKSPMSLLRNAKVGFKLPSIIRTKRSEGKTVRGGSNDVVDTCSSVVATNNHKTDSEDISTPQSVAGRHLFPSSYGNSEVGVKTGSISSENFYRQDHCYQQVSSPTWVDTSLSLGPRREAWSSETPVGNGSDGVNDTWSPKKISSSSCDYLKPGPSYPTKSKSVKRRLEL